MTTTDSDLTTKARIRNAALDLFAEQGPSAVSMRAIAARAGVAVGLVQHHFKTKSGVEAAVERLIVDRHADAIAAVADDIGAAEEIAAQRDQAVRAMLDANPAIVGYMRRALLEPGGGQLLGRLVELTRSEVVGLRAVGAASTRRTVAEQVTAVLIRQLGGLFLQPMIDSIWTQVADGPDGKPYLDISTRTESAKARTSSSVVSHEHIQRTSPAASSQK